MMSRFLKYSVLFLAIIAILLAACEWMVRTTPNSYTLKDELMQRSASRFKTVVMGGSHTYYGVKPELVGDSVVNLANVSQGHEYDYFLLTKYEKALTNLKTVVLIVDESNIFDPPFEDDDREWFRAIFYKIYYRYPKHGDLSKYNFEMSNVATFTQKFKKALKYHLTGKVDPDCDSLGWGCTFTAHNEFDTTAFRLDAAKTLERHRCKNWDNVGYNVDYLNKIGEWCNRRGVEIVVITTPMWDEFVAGTSARQLAVMREVIARFTARYHAKYHDYLCDPRFQGLDFHDPDHLSDIGAVKFSKILKTDFPEL